MTIIIFDNDENRLSPDKLTVKHRITNSCGSFHSKLNVSFSVAHPNTIVLVDTLHEVQNETHISVPISSLTKQQPKNKYF